MTAETCTTMAQQSAMVSDLFVVFWRPLLGGVQYAQHSHQIAGCVVNQDVILMRNHLTSSSDTARAAKIGMLNQAGRFL